MNIFVSPQKYLAAAIALMGIGSVGQLDAQVTFTPLGTPTTINTSVDVSDDGSVVVGVGTAGAFRWTQATGAVSLRSALPQLGGGIFVSGNGGTIAGTDVSLRPFLWTESTGVEYVGAGERFRTSGISSDGTTIVGSSGYQAFRWNETGGTTNLGNLGGPFADAHAVSSDGSAVTGSSSDGIHDPQPYLWTEADGMRALSLPERSNYGRVGTAINSDGSIVAGYTLYDYRIGTRPFLWSENTGLEAIGPTPSNETSAATGVSDDGKIVVGRMFFNGFIWTPHSGLRALSEVLLTDYGLSEQVSGWSYLEADAITPDGRYIVGHGNHDNSWDNWLLDRGLDPPPIGRNPALSPVPEPAIYGLSASCFLLVLARWRHRKRKPCLAS